MYFVSQPLPKLRKSKVEAKDGINLLFLNMPTKRRRLKFGRDFSHELFVYSTIFFKSVKSVTSAVLSRPVSDLDLR